MHRQGQGTPALRVRRQGLGRQDAIAPLSLSLSLSLAIDGLPLISQGGGLQGGKAGNQDEPHSEQRIERVTIPTLQRWKNEVSATGRTLHDGQSRAAKTQSAVQAIMAQLRPGPTYRKLKIRDTGCLTLRWDYRSH